MLPRGRPLSVSVQNSEQLHPHGNDLMGHTLSSNSRGHRCGSLTHPFLCAAPSKAWLRAQEASTDAKPISRVEMLHSDSPSTREQVAVVVGAVQSPERQKWLAGSSPFCLAAAPLLRAPYKAQQGKRPFTFPDETTRGQWSTLAGGCSCRTRKVGRSF